MAAVQLIKRDSIADQVEGLHQRIAERAYARHAQALTIGSKPSAEGSENRSAR